MTCESTKHVFGWIIFRYASFSLKRVILKLECVTEKSSILRYVTSKIDQSHISLKHNLQSFCISDPFNNARSAFNELKLCWS